MRVGRLGSPQKHVDADLGGEAAKVEALLLACLESRSYEEVSDGFFGLVIEGGQVSVFALNNVRHCERLLMYGDQKVSKIGSLMKVEEKSVARSQ